MVDINLTLPDGYLEAEERDGYLVSKEMKEIWAVELDLLNEFIKVCERHQIKYYADGGTILGAVRHGGFIPWDDDIDLVMERKEFEKLDKIALYEFKYPYFWQTEETDPGSFRGHAQLRNSLTTGILKSEFGCKYNFNQGIFIDIFPMDHIPDNPDQQHIFFAKLEKQQKKALRYTYFTSRFENNERGMKGCLKTYYHNLLNRFPEKNMPYKKFERLMCSYNSKPTSLTGKLFFLPMEEKFIWDAKWFESGIKFPFEMLNLQVPAGYDEMMTKFYGDWRTPSISKSGHGNIVFDVNRPYTESLK